MVNQGYLTRTRVRTRRVVTKKDTPLKVCLFLLNEADGARTRDLSRDRAAL